MHPVPVVTAAIDVDPLVATLITCMTKAAQQTVPKKQKSFVQNNFPQNHCCGAASKAAQTLDQAEYLGTSVWGTDASA